MVEKEFKTGDDVLRDIAGGNEPPQEPTNDINPEDNNAAGDVVDDDVPTPDNTSVDDGDNSSSDEPKGNPDEGGDDDDIDVEAILAALEEGNDDNPVNEPSAPEFNVSEFAQELGFEADSLEGLTESISTIKNELSEVKSKNEELSKYTDAAPELLKEAFEVAKDGGDYLEYLGLRSVDYDKIDPLQLFDMDIKGKFGTNPTEQEKEIMQDIISDTPDRQKYLRGLEIRESMKTAQASKIGEIKQRGLDRAQAEKDSIKKALNGMEKVDGFKVSEAYKQNAANRADTGSFEKSLFSKPNGEKDYAKMVRLDFIDKNFANIAKLLKTTTRNDTIRQLIDGASNVNLKGNTANVQTKKPESSDPILDIMKKSGYKSNEV